MQKFIQINSIVVEREESFTGGIIYVDELKIESMYKNFKEDDNGSIFEYWVLCLISGNRIIVTVDEFLKFDLL
jgi:hypothetical protein